jgi:hypothetical protein
MPKYMRGRDFKERRDLELDDITNEWLRENDPYYTDSNKGKRKKLEYNYETPKQEAYRKGKEIPFCGLFGNILCELEEKNVDVKTYLNLL